MKANPLDPFLESHSRSCAATFLFPEFSMCYSAELIEGALVLLMEVGDRVTSSEIAFKNLPALHSPIQRELGPRSHDPRDVVWDLDEQFDFLVVQR